MLRKNHHYKKLEFDHNFVVDLRYIRKRETHYLVNKMAVPAWVTFAIWATTRGIRTQLHESLSSESKYVTLIVRDFSKGKDFEFIVRFSDHEWIDRGIFRRPNYEVGIKASTLADVIAEIEKIVGALKLRIEIGKPNKDGHHCDLEMCRTMENGKTKFFVYCKICNRRSQITNLESGAHTSWKNGARIELDKSCTTK